MVTKAGFLMTWLQYLRLCIEFSILFMHQLLETLTAVFLRQQCPGSAMEQQGCFDTMPKLAVKCWELSRAFGRDLIIRMSPTVLGINPGFAEKSQCPYYSQAPKGPLLQMTGALQ